MKRTFDHAKHNFPLLEGNFYSSECPISMHCVLANE